MSIEGGVGGEVGASFNFGSSFGFGVPANKLVGAWTEWGWEFRNLATILGSSR